MDDGGPTAGYVIFVALLLIDVLFYGFGEAVRALNSKELAQEYEEKGNKKALRLLKIMEKPEQYVNTVQLAVTLINLVMGGFFLEYFRRSLRIPWDEKLAYAVTGAALLYIVLTFGVLLPKKLGAKYATGWAYVCINPIYYFTKICSPLTGLISVTVKGVLWVFGIRGEDDQEDVTEEEIISMVNEGHEQGVLLAAEAEMITKIFEFDDKEAQDIMTHRKNILAMEENMTLSQALDYMLGESKSRFPVYKENVDNIIGILHFKDAMRAYRDPVNMERPIGGVDGLVRETMFVPETKHIDVLFEDMQHSKTQMVIVVDEYGQTAGLIAMEDILEEIVGNILDEYDEEEAYIAETDNEDEYVIDGITPLEELEERLEISFHEDEFETLNGFLISKMDKIPEEEDRGFSVDAEGYRFEVISVENRMIKSVLVTKIPEAAEEGNEEEDSTVSEEKGAETTVEK